MTLPDTPPTPGYVAANNNSLLDWTATNGWALPEVLSWGLSSNQSKVSSQNFLLSQTFLLRRLFLFADFSSSQTFLLCRLFFFADFSSTQTFPLPRLFLLADLKVCEEEKSVKRKSPKRKNLWRGKTCEGGKVAKRKSLRTAKNFFS